MRTDVWLTFKMLHNHSQEYNRCQNTGYLKQAMFAAWRT